MKRSIEYYKNRIDILESRGYLMNEHLIKKLRRQIRKMEQDNK